MAKCKVCGVQIPRGEVLCHACAEEIKHKRSEAFTTIPPHLVPKIVPPNTGSNVKPADNSALKIKLSDEYQHNHLQEAVDYARMTAKTQESGVRSFNVGTSDYSKHKIQPWDIWIEYKLNPFDADIIKRVLRHKKTDSRKMDYEKIIHICQERIRQIDNGEDVWEDK